MPDIGMKTFDDAMGRVFRKHTMESTVFSRYRTLFLLCCGCTTFFVLHNAFGGLRTPSAGPVETFPRKIWQSWKLDALRFEARDAERAMTWTKNNPSWRYEVLTDLTAETYVQQHYGPHGFDRPDIVSIYMSLTARIIQADLLRYLIMYVEGGVWADVDVEALKPIDHFIPKRFKESDADMVIGIETDEPALRDHPVLGSKAQSFCQWTFMCKPRLPVMLRLVENILIWLSRLAEQQKKPISDLVFNFDEVLNGTGPSAFTTAILAEMSATTGKKITWMDFHDLEESVVVGKVLVLPSEAFAAGTGHSRSGNHNGRGALVKHWFHASSWTTKHPRLKNPIYGEVERCNWDVECVKLWDANTAFFAALPEEDQRKMIAMKDREDAAAAAEPEKSGEDAAAPDTGLLPEVAPQEPHIDLRESQDDMPDLTPAAIPAAIPFGLNIDASVDTGSERPAAGTSLESNKADDTPTGETQGEVPMFAESGEDAGSGLEAADDTEQLPLEA